MNKQLFKFNFFDLWLGLMLFLSAGAIVYFVYALNWLGLIASLIITIILFFGLKTNFHNIPALSSQGSEAIKKSDYIFGTLSLLLDVVALILVCLGRTDTAIITPWTEISPWFFVIIALNSLTLMAALSRPTTNIYKSILLAAYYFSIFSVAAIVYRIGYGFDPFIHQAAMAEISRYGYILPKTPYYLGQYSLVAALDKIGLSVFYVNQWLLPALSALSLPFLLSCLHHGRNNKQAVWITSLCLLLIGFSPFIITTPQNFSYLLLLATVIFLYKNAPWPLSAATALATFAVHPLAGLPAIFLTLWNYIPKIWPRCEHFAIYKRPVYLLAAAILVFCLAIWAIAGFSPLRLQSYNLGALTPEFSNQESYVLNLSYFLINNYFWLLLGGALLIFFKRRQLWSKNDSYSYRAARILGLTALAALAAYLISRGFHFEGLIAYEQEDYAARLPIIALILIVPLYWELIYRAVLRVRELPVAARLISMVGVSLLLTAAVYSSYPRFDNYHNSRGYSTSAADIAAVKLAEEKGQGEKYITLANQQVSAAALREFGFRNRYLPVADKEIYFYPIPTGGDLYKYYLDMVYIKAEADTMRKAMDFADVDRAFLIINRYWWASDKIIAEAKLSADSWERINQGEVYLFEYNR